MAEVAAGREEAEVGPADQVEAAAEAGVVSEAGTPVQAMSGAGAVAEAVSEGLRVAKYAVFLQRTWT